MKEELKTRVSHWKSTVGGWLVGAFTIALPMLMGKDLSEITWEQIAIAVVIGLVVTLARDDHFKRGDK
jgi:hypothetical protein